MKQNDEYVFGQTPVLMSLWFISEFQALSIKALMGIKSH